MLQSSNYDSWVSVKLGCIPLQCCRSEIIAFNDSDYDVDKDPTILPEMRVQRYDMDAAKAEYDKTHVHKGGAEDVQKAEWYLNHYSDIVGEYSNTVAISGAYNKMRELVHVALGETK